MPRGCDLAHAGIRGTKCPSTNAGITTAAANIRRKTTNRHPARRPFGPTKIRRSHEGRVGSGVRAEVFEDTTNPPVFLDEPTTPKCALSSHKGLPISDNLAL